MVAFHLVKLGPRVAEQHPWLVIYVVVTAVVTRVVVYGPLREFRRDLETPRSDQLPNEVGGMNDLVRTTELGKLVLDRVETVGTVHDDLTNFVFVEGFDQRLGHRLVEVLVAEPTDRFTVAKFLAREAGKVYACFLQNADESLRRLLVAIVVGTGAADVVEELGIGLVSEGRDVHPFGPLEPQPGIEPPRIGLRLHVLEGAGKLLGETGLLLHQMTAHVDDLVDVLDQRGTSLLTGSAGVTSPECVVVDNGTDNVFADLGGFRAILIAWAAPLFNDLVLMLVEVVPQIE